MSHIETDYLVIGAGALGMAFTDSLIAQSDAHVAIVDRHAKPGGHWNVAYPYVTLHQPSATYGINSRDLDDDRKDASGPNAGLYALATGTQVRDYFEAAMREAFLPSGQVSYHPMSDYTAGEGGEHRFRSIMGGGETRVTVRRKVVDGRDFTARVPATEKRKFAVADGVRVATPGDLPRLWLDPEFAAPSQYVVLGAGKTAMDAATWLLQMGVAPGAIAWVRPRETWMINRLATQPGADFVKHTVDWQLHQMLAAAEAQSADDIFLALEERGHMLRLDTERLPTKFVFPTIAGSEVDMLRTIANVIRIGRIERVEPGRLIGAEGEASIAEDALLVDCTASAAPRQPVEPIWQPGRIVPQLLQVPLVSLSAAVTGHIEATFPDDDAAKNAVAMPAQITDSPAHYPQALLNNAMNRMLWSQNEALSGWLAQQRLDPGARIARVIGGADAETKKAAMRIREATVAAVPNLQKLAMQAQQAEAA